jgi:hypothetical protein
MVHGGSRTEGGITMNVFLVYSKESDWDERQALEMLLKAVFDNVYTWNPKDQYYNVNSCDLVIVLTNPADDNVVNIGRGIHEFMDREDETRTLWITNDTESSRLCSHMFNVGCEIEHVSSQYGEKVLHNPDFADWKNVTCMSILDYEGCTVNYNPNFDYRAEHIAFSKVFGLLLEKSIKNAIDYPPVLEPKFKSLLYKLSNYQVGRLDFKAGAVDMSDIFTAVPINNLLLLYKHNQR